MILYSFFPSSLLYYDEYFSVYRMSQIFFSYSEVLLALSTDLTNEADKNKFLSELEQTVAYMRPF